MLTLLHKPLRWIQQFEKGKNYKLWRCNMHLDTMETPTPSLTLKLDIVIMRNIEQMFPYFCFYCSFFSAWINKCYCNCRFWRQWSYYLFFGMDVCRLKLSAHGRNCCSRVGYLNQATVGNWYAQGQTLYLHDWLQAFLVWVLFIIFMLLRVWCVVPRKATNRCCSVFLASDPIIVEKERRKIKAMFIVLL